MNGNSIDMCVLKRELKAKFYGGFCFVYCFSILINTRLRSRE